MTSAEFYALLTGMNPTKARKCLRAIRAMSGDDEAAHIWEDRFRSAILMAIAAGSPAAVQLARLGLRTDKIAFSRWCA